MTVLFKNNFKLHFMSGLTFSINFTTTGIYLRDEQNCSVIFSPTAASWQVGQREPVMGL